MRVGFIGLGRMGQGMARNLLASGVELVVYDRDQRASTPLGEAGAESARSVAEVAHDASVIFTSLPGPAEVEDVLLSRDGVLANMTAGLTLFDTSTSSPTLARRIHDAFRQRGASMLDAPISGGPAGAAAGELVLWVGGDRAVFDEHLALLNAIGNPRFVGPIGAGTVTKLAHNLTALMIFQSLAETFSLGVKAGVEPFELWSAMRLGVLGRGSPLDLVTKQFLRGEYEQPTMALRLAHKDAALATSLGRELGVPMRLANLTMEELTESMARGLGEQDVQAFLKLQLERAGVEIAVDPERIQAVLDASVR
jgi:3-hydroxyisobutyrate dehydrogenase